MDEKKLVKLLEEKLIKLLDAKFPTKKDFSSLSKKVDNLGRESYDFRDFVSKNVATKKDMRDAKIELLNFKLEMYEFRKETKESFKDIDEHLNDIDEKLKEVKPLEKSFDKILEQHPIERITRLEKHAKLPEFSPAV
jgi:hypothetical protein